MTFLKDHNSTSDVSTDSAKRKNARHPQSNSRQDRIHNTKHNKRDMEDDIEGDAETDAMEVLPQRSPDERGADARRHRHRHRIHRHKKAKDHHDCE